MVFQDMFIQGWFIFIFNVNWLVSDHDPNDLVGFRSFMGDEGWANRGESPATLGAVGIAMRSALPGNQGVAVFFFHIIWDHGV
jgi:hypothetical protein